MKLVPTSQLWAALETFNEKRINVPIERKPHYRIPKYQLKNYKSNRKHLF